MKKYRGHVTLKGRRRGLTGGEAPCKKSVRNIHTNIYTYLLLNFEFFLTFLSFLSFL
jgi:hypothetical protein